MLNSWNCTFWVVTCQGQDHQLRSIVNNVPLNEELEIMNPYLGYMAAMFKWLKSWHGQGHYSSSKVKLIGQSDCVLQKQIVYIWLFQFYFRCSLVNLYISKNLPISNLCSLRQAMLSTDNSRYQFCCEIPTI